MDRRIRGMTEFEPVMVLAAGLCLIPAGYKKLRRFMIEPPTWEYVGRRVMFWAVCLAMMAAYALVAFAPMAIPVFIVWYFQPSLWGLVPAGIFAIVIIKYWMMFATKIMDPFFRLADRVDRPSDPLPTPQSPDLAE